MAHTEPPAADPGYLARGQKLMIRGIASGPRPISWCAAPPGTSGSPFTEAGSPHLHCAPAGVNGNVIMLLAGFHVNGWDVDGQWISTATVSNANFVDNSCGGTLAEIARNAARGNVYVNAHSVAKPGSEPAPPSSADTASPSSEPTSHDQEGEPDARDADHRVGQTAGVP